MLVRKRKRSNGGDLELKLSRNDLDESIILTTIYEYGEEKFWYPTSVSFDGVHLEFGCLDYANRTFWIFTVNSRTLKHQLKSVSLIENENNISSQNIWCLGRDGIVCLQKNGTYTARLRIILVKITCTCAIFAFLRFGNIGNGV